MLVVEQSAAARMAPAALEALGERQPLVVVALAAVADAGEAAPSEAQRLAERGWRTLFAGLVFTAGALTAAAPWLMQSSAAHVLLQALGCRSLV